MSKIKKAALVQELQKRKKYTASQSFKFEDYAFDKQEKFFRKRGKRFRTAVCSRRAGKTLGIALDMVDTCANQPNSLCLYITMTKQNARNIIWTDLVRLCEENKLDVAIDNTRLHIKFHNGSRIACEGVNNRMEIEKIRGWKLRKAYVDECQSFRPYLKELLKDIIIPALRDHRGQLYLTGTPGPIPAGTFYEYSTSGDWDNHHWTAFDNPHMHDPKSGKDLEVTLAEERALFNINSNDPGYQRETYGLWIEDLNSLVFKFSKHLNVYSVLPQSETLQYIIGSDIGYNDSDAISVVAFDPYTGYSYLVEEYVKSKQDITSFVEEIKGLKSVYNPIKIVMDAGALGKKIMEEINNRHGLMVEAAEKVRKVEFIELLNDDMRNGRFKAFEGSQFEEDCMRLQWDLESRIKTPDKPKISDTFHSDITDSTLYAWRACQHYYNINNRKPKLTPALKVLDDERKEAAEMKFKQENPEMYDLMKSFESFNDDDLY